MSTLPLLESSNAPIAAPVAWVPHGVSLIAPLLIGAITDINVVSGDFYALSSVDSIVLDLRFFDDVDVLAGLPYLPCREPVNKKGDPCSGWQRKSTASLRQNCFATTFTFQFGDYKGQSTATVLLGRANKQCEIDWHQGRLDFNPNKVAGSETFARFCHELSCVVEHAELVKWDWALDMVNMPRENVRIARDRRSSDSRDYIGNAMTEYLGPRQKSGRIKLYDKRAELKTKTAHWMCGAIDTGKNVTRMEMTIDPRGRSDDDNVLTMKSCWPRLVCANKENLLGAKGQTAALAMAVAEAIAEARPYQHLLQMLDYRGRKKILSMATTNVFLFPEKCAMAALLESKSWKNFALKSSQYAQNPDFAKA